MSTIHPTVRIEIARAAAELDVGAAPSAGLGGDIGAQQGTLSIMVGGDGADFERARPLFEVLGQDDRARRRRRRGPGRQGLQPDRRRDHDRGGERRLWCSARRPAWTPSASSTCRRRPRRQQGDGGAAAQLPGARLHAGLPDRPPSQGPEHRAGVRRRVRRPLPATGLVQQLLRTLRARARAATTTQRCCRSPRISPSTESANPG